MLVTGFLLFFAIPVRTTQSVWFRIKLVLLLAALVNAVLFHRRLRAAGDSWQDGLRAPVGLRRGAGLSIAFWVGIVICGRLIAYDWYDCIKNPHPLLAGFAGCLPDQEVF
jgi:hypothetical protein